MYVGKSVLRLDAKDKVLGRTRYTEDLCPSSALVAKIYHARIAHGYVRSIDCSAAAALEGVVKVLTCFDVPDLPFPTAGHPWSCDKSHQDVADRHLLNRHIRYYGDDIALVIAETALIAKQALELLKVEYEELPFALDVEAAMAPGAAQLHEAFPHNILAHTSLRLGDVAQAIEAAGADLIKVEGCYETPTVQHCHIENPISYAYEEAGKLVVVSSTQIPHIVRRVVAQALGLPWGKVRIIKPFIGGGFGNKQDALYEPLNAFASQAVGGKLVVLDLTREETFANTRVRHAIKFEICSWVKPDGTLVARRFRCLSDQGAYASHGHGIAAKGMGSFPQLYPCPNVEADAYTVFTNKAVAGAMRGYGIPQAMFAGESHIDDIALALGLEPLAYRQKVCMPLGYVDAFSQNKLYHDSFKQCLAKGSAALDYERKRHAYAQQTGDIRRGVGVAIFWYNTGVWPISLESSSCRMVLNQDGSVQVQLAETEIGQGADTVFAQMTADAIGLDLKDVHVVSCQDTDVTPFGTGAYASRQTYMGGFAIAQTATMLKQRILELAWEVAAERGWDEAIFAEHFAAYADGAMSINAQTEPTPLLDIVAGNIIRCADGQVLLSVGELATEVLYSMKFSEHVTAESTAQIKTNAYSFGCSFAEVEVDIPLCKVKLLQLVNVHDCGTLINPALAEAQVHGGMSMAIGYGLSEKCLFDPKTGRMLNDNLLDYKLSTALDHPDLTALFVENPEPTSPYGTKALGEPPTCSGAPAIRNAILQACGVGLNCTPMTPHVLFEAFSQAGLLG